MKKSENYADLNNFHKAYNNKKLPNYVSQTIIDLLMNKKKNKFLGFL